MTLVPAVRWHSGLAPGMAVVLAAAAVVVCGLVLGAGEAQAGGRTLTAPDLPSLDQKRVGQAAVRQVLSSRLRGSLRLSLARGATEASAFSGGGLSVLAGSVQLRSAAQSRKLLGRWKTSRPRPRRVATGDGGLVIPRGKGKIVVLVRVGSSVGLVQLRARSVTASRRELALALARKLAGRLQSANAATPIDDLLDRVRADGSVSKATALAAFERLYGDVPGVNAGPPAGHASIDGNLAIGWVLDHRSDLSPAQRRAVERALGAGLGAADPSGNRTRSAAGPRFVPNAELLRIAKERAEVYAGLLGEPLQLELVVGFVPRLGIVPSTGTAATADAFPVDIDGNQSDDPKRCRIRYSRASWNASAPAERLHALAHEVFHCYEFQLNPANWGGTSNVAIEGLAEWAAASTVRPYAEPWRSSRAADYFPQPEKSLAKRPYASVFFWGRIEEHDGRPLWDSMRALIATQGFDDLMLVAGGGNEDFSDIWPSSFKLDPSMGPAWTTSHPSPVAQSDGAAPGVVTDKAPIKAARYTNRLYTLAPDDDDTLLARVELERGRARVGATDDSLAADRIVGAGEIAWLCLDEASECAVCPNGEPTAQPPHDDVGEKPIVAVAGADTGAAGTIEFRDAHENCGEDTGPGYSNTDPAYCPTSKKERLPNSKAGSLRWHRAAIEEDLGLRQRLVVFADRLDGLQGQIDALGPISGGTPESERHDRLRNEIWRVELEAWPSYCRHLELEAHSLKILLGLLKRGVRRGGNAKDPYVRLVNRFYKIHLKTSVLADEGRGQAPKYNPLATGLPYPQYP